MSGRYGWTMCRYTRYYLDCGAQRIIIILGVKLPGGSNKVKGCAIDYAWGNITRTSLSLAGIDIRLRSRLNEI